MLIDPDFPQDMVQHKPLAQLNEIDDIKTYGLSIINAVINNDSGVPTPHG